MIKIFILVIYILCMFIYVILFVYYKIVIKIKYKWQVEHVLISDIHVNMWWWIVMLWDVKIVDMGYGCK